MKITDPQENILKTDIPTSEQFKAWREGLGWTRREAASMLQYSNASAISQIETGSRQVPKRVAVMMKLYDLTYDNLGGSSAGNTATESG